MPRFSFACLTAGLWVGALGLARADAPAAQPPTPSSHTPSTLVCDGAVYVALPALDSWFGFASERPGVAAQKVRVEFEHRTWEFLNGGDRVALPDGREEMLSHPLLVIAGELYLHEHDAASLFGVQVSPTSVAWRDRHVAAVATRLETGHHIHRIAALQPVSFGLRLTRAAAARTALHSESAPVTLPAGATYVCRRQVTIDEIPCYLLTDAGVSPHSFIVAVDALKGGSQPADVGHSAWARRLNWFRTAAQNGLGLRSGPRESLAKSLCATADFCWSLRPMETDFLLHLPAAAQRENQPALTLFISGRWLEQHPADMETLLTLGEGGDVALTFGLHSWIHPKAGDFMNDLSVADVRSDTLRLERQLLEWGIVPTVYYRFPGLIHDPARLQAILALDLLPIDCDAWVAVQTEGMHPFGGPIRAGSIVLVHGNGNEPIGIARFQLWLRGHEEWRWRPLADFLPITDTSLP